ncbi:MAG: murein L,D-transpeptidase [Chloroflexi bacterium]|nr:murein L,D-transpeptidase [Chloroflexota bacterium]
MLVENADADAGTTRLFAREAGEQNFGYIEAVTLNPTDAPPGEAGSSPASGAFRPFWAATLEVTELSNGRKNGSEVIATLPQFAKVMVLGQPGDGTYYVQDARTARVGTVDGSKVGPSSSPTPEDEVIWSSPAFATIPDGHRPWWVEATRASDLWSAATGGASFGPVKIGDRFIVMEPQSGTRLTIFNPVTRNFAYIDLDAVTKSGAPKAATVEVGGWVGIVAGERANLRQEPHTVMAVTEAPVPPTMSLGQNGAKWIDVNITQQVVVAYEGATRVYMAAVTSGRPGWSTPLGVFKVLRRVENETMLGSTLLRLDSGEVPDYKLENVKWTQYFTNGGAALHTNYWRGSGTGRTSARRSTFTISEIIRGRIASG